MPRIVRFHQIGGPEVLRIEESTSQQPGQGEVKLRVQASGLNRAESLYFHGRYLEQPQLPSRIGYEVAGVVEAVGDGVDTAWLGKPVATIPGFSQNRYGTLGEEAIVPAHVLAEYPPNLTPIQAAASWMQFTTAYGALVHFGAVKPGDIVSIPAASSSVGLAAIQIVRDAGATAIAVTRTSAKRAELLALGAQHVIASQEEDYVARIKEITGGSGVRLTFDPVGGPFIQKLAAASAQGGTIFEYGLLSGEPTPFPLSEALPRCLSIRGHSLMGFPHERAVKYIFARLADGRFVPKVARTFPFAQTVEAYRYLESNQQIGKVVITVP
jgi:NADPH:quinone reductase-like Zn-dependent oxidoreductase